MTVPKLCDGNGDGGSVELAELRGINEALAEIEYLPHLSVLQAVAFVEADDEINETKTGRVIAATQRLATDQAKRTTVEHSLGVLYDLGFLDRERPGAAKAYDWQLSPRGRALLADIGLLSRLEALADSEGTDGL